MKRFCLSLLACVLFTASPVLAKDGILLVMFGTTVPSAKVALDALEADFNKAYGAQGPIVVAYTSEIIRKKLKKQGTHVFSIEEGLNALAQKGVTNLTVQSFHVAPAAEFMETERMMVRNIINNPTRFTSAKLGDPLLVSKRDLDDTIKVVLASIPAERKSHEAVVLMGHGNNHGPGDLVLLATANAFTAADKNVHLACVEGGLSFDHTLATLKASKVKTVWLMPFMIVAGDHAVNDLVGPEEDSWASILKKEGFEVRQNVVGLGQLQGIRDIYLRHAKDAYLDLAPIVKAD